jgi:hypothetical protein
MPSTSAGTAARRRATTMVELLTPDMNTSTRSRPRG